MRWRFFMARLRYWKNRFQKQVLGICPACGTRCNLTTAGRMICPECGR